VARLRWAALAVLASITLAACGGAAKSPTTAPGQVADPTTTTAPSPPVARSFDDLSKAIITAVPAGYALQPDSVDDTGPSNLEKAISDDLDQYSRL
jgi:ABC-type glycerol-3-phosphate transport system substrate-binding protein